MAIIMKRLRWPYWVFSIVVGGFGPALLAQLNLDQMIRFGLINTLLFSVIAGLIGTLVKHRQESPWVLLVWPAVFLVGALISGPIDTTVFALIYLCISYLSYGFSRVVQ